jgi:hypothetical protein
VIKDVSNDAAANHNGVTLMFQLIPPDQLFRVVVIAVLQAVVLVFVVVTSFVMPWLASLAIFGWVDFRLTRGLWRALRPPR